MFHVEHQADIFVSGIMGATGDLTSPVSSPPTSLLFEPIFDRIFLDILRLR